MTKQHISYSELKTWAECPWKHNLVYLQGIKGFTGNLYTAIGTAIHSVCENIAKGLLTEDADREDFFDESFDQELAKLDLDDEVQEVALKEFRRNARLIMPLVFPELDKHFPGYEVFSTEERLYQKITELDYDWNLKGFIDLVIKTPDGKYHIIDWKTCSWGWNREKKQDKLVTYQLTLYKKFFCEKHDVDPKLVETYFGLLKRTAKKENVEIYRVTSGPRKTQSATKLLTDGCRSVKAGLKIKNRKNCKFCEFYHTDYCH